MESHNQTSKTKKPIKSNNKTHRTESTRSGGLQRSLRNDDESNHHPVLSVARRMRNITSQPTQSTLPTKHAVQHGETLALIAERFYGECRRSKGMKVIVEANPWIGQGSGIQATLILTIPELNDN